VEIKGLERFFATQDPKVEVFFEKTDKPLPFDIDIRYASRQPKNAKNCPLSSKRPWPKRKFLPAKQCG